MIQRILVLSSSTGSGHDMRARAFRQWVERLHGDSCEVRIEQIIEDGSSLGRFGVWLYNCIHRYAPWLHNVYFFIVEGLILAHTGRVSFGGGYYRQLLRDYRPQVVLSVHDSTNRGYFEDAKRILGAQTRCVTYCGEYSGGYGFSRHWVSSAVDCFIARTRTSADWAVRLGLSPQQVHVFQNFLPPAAFAPLPHPAKLHALRQELGLDPDKLTFFLATGGFGANHHIEFLRAVADLGELLQLVIVCGRNRKLHQRLLDWQQSASGPQIHLEGYSERMADYLRLSDGVITRGGANTTTEAIHFGCPVLFNALGGLMPQERCTVRYLTRVGAAIVLRSATDFRSIAQSWAADRSRARQYKIAVRRFQAPAEHPRALVEKVLNLQRPPLVRKAVENSA